MTTHAARKEAMLPRTLDELTEELTPLAINNERTHRRMQRLIDKLAVLDRRTKAQERYLETLTILVEAYEDQKHDIELSQLSPVGVLKFLVQQHGMTGRDLGTVLGQPQLGGKILRGERELSKAHIRSLCAHFKVGPKLFI